MKSSLSFGTVRSLLATALVLWFAGAGCVFVSYAHSAMSEVSSSASEAACPFHQSTASVSPETAGQNETDTTVVASGHACCKLQPGSAPSTSPTSPAPTGIIAAELLPTTLAGLPPPAGAMSCCPLMSTAVAVVAKPRVDEATAVPVEPARLPALLSSSETTSLSTPLRLPNRGHTYLRCCAFLI